MVLQGKCVLCAANTPDLDGPTILAAPSAAVLLLSGEIPQLPGAP
jgi:hypothetical protein